MVFFQITGDRVTITNYLLSCNTCNTFVPGRLQTENQSLALKDGWHSDPPDGWLPFQRNLFCVTQPFWMCPVYLPVVSTYCGTITKQTWISLCHNLWKCGMCKSMKFLKIRNKCNMVLKSKFYTACGKRVEEEFPNIPLSSFPCTYM